MHCFHSHPTRLFLRYYDTVVFEWDFWVSDRQKNTKQFLLCLFENPKEQKRVFFLRIVFSFSYTLFGYSTSSQSVARLVVLRGRRISEALLVLVLLCVAPWLLPSTFQVPIRPIAEDSFQQGSRRRKKTNNWGTSKLLSQTHKIKSNCAVETMQDIIKANLHRKSTMQPNLWWLHHFCRPANITYDWKYRRTNQKLSFFKRHFNVLIFLCFLVRLHILFLRPTVAKT